MSTKIIRTLADIQERLLQEKKAKKTKKKKKGKKINAPKIAPGQEPDAPLIKQGL